MDDSNPRPPQRSVLFVCLGNICRSPLAEGVFRHLVEERGRDGDFLVDSAGTGAWHVGEPPDRRSEEVAARHGVELNGRARKVLPEDLERFELVIAMDRDNLEDLEALAVRHGSRARLHLLREFDPDGTGDEVPDPYYGGATGFETVYEMVRRSCNGLLEAILDSSEGS
jgi:protein-tyrosine phosphatase